MQKILCLDFDGVIADSRAECMELSLECYMVQNESNRSHVSENLDAARTFFFKHRGLVRPARNFYALWHWALYKQNMTISGSALEALASEMENELDTFEKRFFAERHHRLQTDPEQFLSLNPLFSGVASTWRSLSSPLYIVSTKDKESIAFILKHHNLSSTEIFGRGTLSKVAVMNRICETNKISQADILFVDDNALHLSDAKDAGFTTCWASWGYGPPSNDSDFIALSFEDIASICRYGASDL